MAIIQPASMHVTMGISPSHHLAATDDTAGKERRAGCCGNMGLPCNGCDTAAGSRFSARSFLDPSQGMTAGMKSHTALCRTNRHSSASAAAMVVTAAAAAAAGMRAVQGRPAHGQHRPVLGSPTPSRWPRRFVRMAAAAGGWCLRS